MAIVRLTDIVTTMKDKWTYGDKFFGYTEEFNDNHSTQYPSLLITPPDSVYPEVTPRNGWEEYSFEVYFSDLYNRTAQANESIEQRWDNLQDLANEWLDMFLKSYMGGTTGSATVISYLTDGSLSIERKKEVANDQLLQLKMNFGWKVFSKCFTPVSTYPNQISGLTSWLRADSNVTFSIPTKKVSAVGDGSGNANGVSQTNKELQPLRYTYGGGALDKTMFTFDSDALVSNNNFATSGSNEQFSVFEVSKINAVSDAVFGYYHLADGSYIEMGTNVAGNYEVSVSDGTTLLTKNTGTVNTGKYHIGALRKSGQTIYFNYYDSGNTFYASKYDGVFVNSTSFEQDKFRIGCTQTTDGLIPPAAINTRYLDGDFQEVIIYNRKLTDAETAQVADYLNKKYKIY
jgi:hypothetical protein